MSRAETTAMLSKLVEKRNSYRRRPASEMLYAMIEANGKRTN